MIVFDCPECGRPMQAAEDHAGEQVRCPACQGIVRVPETRRGALSRPLFEPEIVSRSPDGGFREGVADEPRRPCPMCGEMIVASAIKCRFCGEIFDSTLRRQSDNPKLERTYRSQMNGLGGLWIFFACLGLLGLLILIGQPRFMFPQEALL